MCFQLRPGNINGKNVKIAKKDIVCYKKVSVYHEKGKLIYRSSVRGFIYQLGVEVTASFKFAGNWNKSRKDTIENGLHSYKKAVRGNVKCIIPAGANYYMNAEEYCSDKIIMIGLLPDRLADLKQNYTNQIKHYTAKIKDCQLEIKRYQKVLAKL